MRRIAAIVVFLVSGRTVLLAVCRIEGTERKDKRKRTGVEKFGDIDSERGAVFGVSMAADKQCIRKNSGNYGISDSPIYFFTFFGGNGRKSTACAGNKEAVG